ncbi:hypothetical protein [Roseateles sp. LYH14W]|uniref:Uncharacterized protein n=1 Tax=Pelomonas parva TaxID=3299032 RepID=A0ABW7F621_9BURK
MLKPLQLNSLLEGCDRGTTTHPTWLVKLRQFCRRAPALCVAMAGSVPAYGVDGCQVLLCLAAPSWKSISQCVPPVRQVLRDLARGKAFPTCAMAGPGNSASHHWSSAPSFCPQQYTRMLDGPNGPTYTCDYAGAISLTVQGAPFARTWWSLDGDSVTEYTPAAKLQLGSWDERFDAELTVWLALRRATSPTTD